MIWKIKKKYIIYLIQMIVIVFIGVHLVLSNIKIFKCMF